MRIIFFTRRFYPDVGGVEKHTEKISRELVKKGHEVIVISENTKTYKSKEYYKGITIYRIPVNDEKKKKWNSWKWLWNNRYLIKQADVIHAHDVYYWYFTFRFLYPRKRSYITFHGYENYPIKKRAIIVRKISEKLSKGNIIVGEFIKKWYGTQPNFVIYGGTDQPKKIGLPKKKHSALFYGRLDEHTGILDYAEAIKKIHEELPAFKFDIFGDGEYLNKLKEFQPKGFIQNPEKMLKDYKFAFVSRYLSILEAMANKRLVFALYDNPVKEDYLKMAPFKNFIVIGKNSEELSKKVKYFLDNPQKEREMVDKAYDWVSDKTWRNVTDTYLRLWGISSEK